MFLAGTVLLTLASLFFLFAAIGLVKFPDVAIRMSAVSKASTLGVILSALAYLCFDLGGGVFLKVSLLVWFMIFANPVASHLLGRAGILRKLPLISSTKTTEVK